MPEHVIVDTGHPNGRRMRDYAGFGDAHSAKNALLIETGQHFSARSRDVALDAACRFLIVTGAVRADDLESFLPQAKPVRQRVLQVTQSVVAEMMAFEFTEDFARRPWHSCRGWEARKPEAFNAFDIELTAV